MPGSYLCNSIVRTRLNGPFDPSRWPERTGCESSSFQLQSFLCRPELLPAVRSRLSPHEYCRLGLRHREVEG